MMVAMAQSILSQNRIDTHNQAIHYLLWYQYGQYSSTGDCFDIGDQTRTALDFYDRTGRFMEESTRAGNGSLMRVAPAILFGLHQHKLRLRISEDCFAIVLYKKLIFLCATISFSYNSRLNSHT